MKSKKILGLLLILCMAVFAIPFSAGASEAKDVADTLVEELGVSEEAAEAVAEGQQVPENFAASVAYVSDYAGLKAAVEDPAVTIVVVLNDITLEDTLVMDKDNLSLALIALSDVTIYSADQVRHFYLEPDFYASTVKETKLIFSNVTLDGNGTGGGILSERGNDSTVTSLVIDGLVATNCNTVNDGDDGAVVGHNLSVIDSDISGNLVSGIRGVYGWDFSIEDSTVNNNAENGIQMYNIEKLRVVNSDVSGNTQYGIIANSSLSVSSVYMNDCTVNENGLSGIYIDVNRLGIYGVESGILNTEIRGNGASGNVEQGGGVYIETVDGSTYGIENCIIDGNTAFDGGGIYARFMQLGIADCEVKNNIAERGAGVFHDEFIEGDYTGTKIYDNMADVLGGGVYFYNPTSRIRYAWIEAEVYNNESGYNGGGIYVDANLVVGISGDVHGNSARTRGGGVYVTDSSSIAVEGSIYDNSARQGADIWPIQ